jgi:hypothetical protein
MKIIFVFVNKSQTRRIARIIDLSSDHIGIGIPEDCSILNIFTNVKMFKTFYPVTDEDIESLYKYTYLEFQM